MSDDKSDKEGEGDQEALTKEEEAKCWEAFSAFDKDSSGYIDANELRIVLEMMGQKTTEEEIFRIRKIVENVKRVAEYASDIGEIVLNMNIEKILKKPI